MNIKRLVKPRATFEKEIGFHQIMFHAVKSYKMQNIEL